MKVCYLDVFWCLVVFCIFLLILWLLLRKQRSQQKAASKDGETNDTDEEVQLTLTNASDGVAAPPNGETQKLTDAQNITQQIETEDSSMR